MKQQSVLNDLITLKERYKEMGVDTKNIDIDNFKKAFKQLDARKKKFGATNPLMIAFEKEVTKNQKLIQDYKSSGISVSGVSRYMKRDVLTKTLKDKI